MVYIQLDSDNRVIAYVESDTNPDPEVWLESPWETVPEDFADWLYIDGELIHDPRNLPPVPLEAEEVIKAIYTAMPTLTVGIIDKVALRMVPYLPDYDPAQTYTVGCLVIKDGKVQRRTIGGWRVVE